MKPREFRLKPVAPHGRGDGRRYSHDPGRATRANRAGMRSTVRASKFRYELEEQEVQVTADPTDVRTGLAIGLSCGAHPAGESTHRRVDGMAKARRNILRQRSINLLQTFATRWPRDPKRSRSSARSRTKPANRSRQSSQVRVLANMSHELRTRSTPSSVCSKSWARLFGELNEKLQAGTQPRHTDVGRHLPSRSTRFSTSQGRGRPRMSSSWLTFDLPLAIDNARTFVQARHQATAVDTRRYVDERLGDFRRRRAQDRTDPSQSAVQRGQVHAGGRTGWDRKPREPTVMWKSQSLTPASASPRGPAKHLEEFGRSEATRAQERRDWAWFDLGQEVRRAAEAAS